MVKAMENETESETADVEIQDAEAPPLPLRRIAVGACHGAANNLPDDDEGDGHRRADPFGDGTRSRSPRSSTARGSTDAEVPCTETDAETPSKSGCKEPSNACERCDYKHDGLRKLLRRMMRCSTSTRDWM